MSEISPEASVAGQAAAGAVEELHSREEVAEHAAEAQDVAFAAAEEAESAREAASLALEAVAEVASAVVSEERVAETDEKAEAALSAGDRALQENEALRAQMAPIIDYFSRMEAERLAAEDSQPETVGVEEGITSGNAGSNGTAARGDGSSGNGNFDTGPDGQSSPATSRRPRLRRGRK